MKPGDVLAEKYRLDKRLGLGGMGEVWSALHVGTGREFAVKVMHAHAASSPTARQRFSREARASARIQHPSVIDIFDVGDVDDGGLYLVMELLDGVALADAFHQNPTLNVQDFLTIMLDTAGALGAAHAVGIVHRDIKPENIFLHRDRNTGYSSPKLLDFGISKFEGNASHATKAGAILGSPRYMSPEQTRSAADVDPRADIWAVGVVLFEGLTGTWPHEGDSFSSLVVAICTTPPISIDVLAPHLPETVRAIVRDCLQPIEQRITSAAELAGRLEIALQDQNFAYLFLPRPLHPPVEPVRPTSGLRIRPAAQNWGPATGQGRTSAAFLSNAGPSSSSGPYPTGNGAPHPAGPSMSAPYAMGHASAIATPYPMSSSGQAMPSAREGAEMQARFDALQRNAGPIALSAAPNPRPDPLVGTASAMSVEAVGGPMSSQRVGGAPLSQMPVRSTYAPQSSGARRLQVLAAVLGVVLVGIVIALVTVLRSHPPSSVANGPTADSSALVAPPEPPPAPASAAPIETAAPIASAAPIETAAPIASAAPIETAAPIATEAAPQPAPKPVPVSPSPRAPVVPPATSPRFPSGSNGGSTRSPSSPAPSSKGAHPTKSGAASPPTRSPPFKGSTKGGKTGGSKIEALGSGL